MRPVNFSVDSRLLRELGERLVGRPHIALAELVKNAYDADATRVLIRFGDGTIEVIDDGHGMTFDEFRDRWMRIGSTHKEEQGISRLFRRPLTGSKGVGRLAVQLLAKFLELESRTEEDLEQELVAEVDWTTAVDAGLLTKATADVGVAPRGQWWPGDQRTGTRIVLTGLNQVWTPDQFAELAREIWPLQPPFKSGPGVDAQDFAVVLESPDRAVVSEFDRQMRAVLDLWTARLVGELLPVDAAAPQDAYEVMRPATNPTRAADVAAADEWEPSAEFSKEASPDNPGQQRTVRLRLQFAGEQGHVVHYRIADCHLDLLNFEIRVFSLNYRQPFGIRVQDARGYLRRFGGVHVYDAGFHLPYYGSDTDWLRIEQDHSHRLSRSGLLPDALQAHAGLQYLPTNSRLFGVVNVNTTHESRAAQSLGSGQERDALRIQVSRDRLLETQAYRDLIVCVRWAIDYYAMREAARGYERLQAHRSVELPPVEQVESIEKVLQHYRAEMPERVFEDISSEVRTAVDSARSDARATAAQVGLLGALATAGITALAYEHEVGKQFDLLTALTHKLRAVATHEGAPNDFADLVLIADEIDEWIERAQATRALFSPLMNEDNRVDRQRFKARALVEDVVGQVEGLGRGAEIDATAVDPELRLPEGGFAEWSALLQNLFINAFNAMLDRPVRRIDVSSGSEGVRRWLLVQDTGVGIDLGEADQMFEPFKRKQTISNDRAALGLGGTGLGLTIVRMLAGELHCSVAFIEPDEAHATAVQIEWREMR